MYARGFSFRCREDVDILEYNQRRCSQTVQYKQRDERVPIIYPTID